MTGGGVKASVPPPEANSRPLCGAINRGGNSVGVPVLVSSYSTDTDGPVTVTVPFELDDERLELALDEDLQVVTAERTAL